MQPKPLSARSPKVEARRTSHHRRPANDRFSRKPAVQVADIIAFTAYQTLQHHPGKQFIWHRWNTCLPNAITTTVCHIKGHTFWVKNKLAAISQVLRLGPGPPQNYCIYSAEKTTISGTACLSAAQGVAEKLLTALGGLVGSQSVACDGSELVGCGHGDRTAGDGMAEGVKDSARFAYCLCDQGL